MLRVFCYCNLKLDSLFSSATVYMFKYSILLAFESSKSILISLLDVVCCIVLILVVVRFNVLNDSRLSNIPLSDSLVCIQQHFMKVAHFIILNVSERHPVHVCVSMFLTVSI